MSRKAVGASSGQNLRELLAKMNDEKPAWKSAIEAIKTPSVEMKRLANRRQTMAVQIQRVDICSEQNHICQIRQNRFGSKFPLRGCVVLDLSSISSSADTRQKRCQALTVDKIENRVQARAAR